MSTDPRDGVAPPDPVSQPIVASYEVRIHLRADDSEKVPTLEEVQAMIAAAIESYRPAFKVTAYAERTDI